MLLPSPHRPRLGLALTTEGWRVAVVRRENGGIRVEHDAPLEPDGADADPEALGRRLADHLRRHGIRERRCAVRLPLDGLLGFAADVPALDPEDQRSFLELEAEKALPVPAAEVRLAWWTPSGDAGQAMVAALPEARLETVRRMLAAASVQAVSLAADLDPGDLAGEDGLDLLAHPGHVLALLRADGLPRAWQALPDPASEPPERMAAALRMFLHQQPADLRGRVRVVRWIGAAPSPARVQALDGFVQTLDGARWEPLGDRPRPGDAGAAIRAAGSLGTGSPVVFEFAPPRPHRVRAWARPALRKGAAPAAAALALFALVAGVRAGQERRLQRRAEALAPTVAELTRIQQRIRRYRPWYADDAAHVAVLAALATAFPEEGSVWARRIEARDSGRFACAGMARSQPDFMATLERFRQHPQVRDVQVQSVRGANPVQFVFDFGWGPDRHE